MKSNAIDLQFIDMKVSDLLEKLFDGSVNDDNFVIQCVHVIFFYLVE